MPEKETNAEVLKSEVAKKMQERYLAKLSSRLEGAAAKKAEWGNRQLLNDLTNFSFSNKSLEDIINELDVMVQVAFPDENNEMRQELIAELSQFRQKK